MTQAVHDLLEQYFDTAFAAPDGIVKLRGLILTLAMQGKLVGQDPGDPHASELLKEIEAEKQRMIAEKEIKRPKLLLPIQPEEVPYEQPQGWKWARLGDICSYIQRGKGPRYADFSTHKVISQKCVRWHGLDLEPARFIEPSSLEKYEPVRFLKVGDLLWNSTGTGTIGRACLVPQGLEDEEIVADSHVTVVRPITVKSMFLWRWIQSPFVQSKILSSASGTTNQIELNTSTVINHLMPIPPIGEQQRIVARIDQLMARCDELEKLHKDRKEKRLQVHTAAIKQLLDGSQNAGWPFIQQHFGELYTVKENVAELRKAILQLAVMGRLVTQDPKDQPASELVKEIEAEKQLLIAEKRIKKSKPLPPIKPEEVPYQLPQGWEWVRLGVIAEIIGGFAYKSNLFKSEGDKQVLRLGNIRPDLLRLSENPVFIDDFLAKSTSSYCLSSGDILITMTGTREKRDYLYSVRVAENPVEGVFLYLNQRVGAIRTFIDSEYLNKVIKVEVLKDIIYRTATGSANQANIGIGALRDWILPIAPLEEQHRIVSRIEQLMALCDNLDNQVEAASGKQGALLNAVMAQV